MTTGGTTQVAYLHEPAGNYGGAPTDSDYKTFGNDAVLSDLSFENALERMGEPGNAEAVDHIAQTFEGAITVSGKLGNPWFHNHVFGGAPTAGGETAAPYSYEWTPAPGEVQSARVYAGVNYASATAEREIIGAVFPQLQVSCNIGETVRFQLTGFYKDEVKNTALTPGSQPSELANTLVFHGGDLTVDATTQARMQSCTLDINTNTRPQRGWQRKPVAAVMGSVETTLSPEKISTDTNLLELAYGGTSGPASTVSGASATLDFTSNADTRMRYDLTGATPNDFSWDEFGDPDADVTESSTLSVDSVTAHAESSQSSAR